MTKHLKLAAQDLEDAKVLTSVFQDALTKAEDLTYLQSQRRFAAVFNRFKWEALHKEVGLFRFRQDRYERIRAGIHFDNVLTVQTQNLPDGNSTEVISLLHIKVESGDDGMAIVTMLFAADVSIRMEVEAIDIRMSDMGEPWYTPSRPNHHIEEDF
jgi:hypothetical protein